ncbi:MAG: ribonuclease P protein component [Candidatus Gracilibacteria bacterium]|nr:ribonuclease P protein component [Candidatus Gracilibacteria bacterium]
MLKKTERIKKSELISLVLSKGQSWRSADFILKYLDSNLGTSLFTVIVPKKLFKTVVQKNKYRRRGMSLLAKRKDQQKKDRLLLLLPGPNFLKAKFADLEKELNRFFKQLGCFAGLAKFYSA